MIRREVYSRTMRRSAIQLTIRTEPTEKQDENTDAHYERRQQPEGEPILIQMILAAAVAGRYGRAARR